MASESQREEREIGERERREGEREIGEREDAVEQN